MPSRMDSCPCQAILSCVWGSSANAWSKTSSIRGTSQSVAILSVGIDVRVVLMMQVIVSNTGERYSRQQVVAANSLACTSCQVSDEHDLRVTQSGHGERPAWPRSQRRMVGGSFPKNAAMSKTGSPSSTAANARSRTAESCRCLMRSACRIGPSNDSRSSVKQPPSRAKWGESQVCLTGMITARSSGCDSL